MANILFDSTDYPWLNACLNYAHDEWGPYVAGYRRSADLLVEHVRDTHTNHDILVYPIVFLYRQFLELQLKQLIIKGYQLLDIRQGFPKHHELDKIWPECKSVLNKVWPGKIANQLKIIEDCIDSLSKIDPESFSFRYPVDKEDNPSLPGITHINLGGLAKTMDEVASLLEAASTGISVYLDSKIETEANLRLCYDED
jgi:hypothetical protein